DRIGTGRAGTTARFGPPGSAGAPAAADALGTGGLGPRRGGRPDGDLRGRLRTDHPPIAVRGGEGAVGGRGGGFGRPRSPRRLHVTDPHGAGLGAGRPFAARWVLRRPGSRWP